MNGSITRLFGGMLFAVLVIRFLLDGERVAMIA
jgi:hypothetical protein